MECESSRISCTAEGDADGTSYVWGDDVHEAKTQAERYGSLPRLEVLISMTTRLTETSLDYLFQLAVEMKKLGLSWSV